MQSSENPQPGIEVGKKSHDGYSSINSMNNENIFDDSDNDSSSLHLRVDEDREIVHKHIKKAKYHQEKNSEANSKIFDITMNCNSNDKSKENCEDDSKRSDKENAKLSRSISPDSSHDSFDESKNINTKLDSKEDTVKNKLQIDDENNVVPLQDNKKQIFENSPEEYEVEGNKEFSRSSESLSNNMKDDEHSNNDYKVMQCDEMETNVENWQPKPKIMHYTNQERTSKECDTKQNISNAYADEIESDKEDHRCNISNINCANRFDEDALIEECDNNHFKDLPHAKYCYYEYCDQLDYRKNGQLSSDNQHLCTSRSNKDTNYSENDSDDDNDDDDDVKSDDTKHSLKSIRHSQNSDMVLMDPKSSTFETTHPSQSYSCYNHNNNHYNNQRMGSYSSNGTLRMTTGNGANLSSGYNSTFMRDDKKIGPKVILKPNNDSRVSNDDRTIYLESLTPQKLSPSKLHQHAQHYHYHRHHKPINNDNTNNANNNINSIVDNENNVSSLRRDLHGHHTHHNKVMRNRIHNYRNKNDESNANYRLIKEFTPMAHQSYENMRPTTNINDTMIAQCRQDDFSKIDRHGSASTPNSTMMMNKSTIYETAEHNDKIREGKTSDKFNNRHHQQQYRRLTMPQIDSRIRDRAHNNSPTYCHDNESYKPNNLSDRRIIYKEKSPESNQHGSTMTSNPSSLSPSTSLLTPTSSSISSSSSSQSLNRDRSMDQQCVIYQRYPSELQRSYSMRSSNEGYFVSPNFDRHPSSSMRYQNDNIGVLKRSRSCVSIDPELESPSKSIGTNIIPPPPPPPSYYNQQSKSHHKKNSVVLSQNDHILSSPGIHKGSYSNKEAMVLHPNDAMHILKRSNRRFIEVRERFVPIVLNFCFHCNREKIPINRSDPETREMLKRQFIDFIKSDEVMLESNQKHDIISHLSYDHVIFAGPKISKVSDHMKPNDGSEGSLR